MLTGWCCVLQAENSIVKQVQAEKDTLLAQVRGQMSDMQRQHDIMASELQRKLDWCVPVRVFCLLYGLSDTTWNTMPGA